VRPWAMNDIAEILLFGLFVVPLLLHAVLQAAL
jgi:hypothetical protein